MPESRTHLAALCCCVPDSCIFNLLKVVLAKGKESFRWADLVSGNLKEEKDASLGSTGAFRWPSPSTRNLLYRYVRQQVRQCLSLSAIVYFCRKASTNGRLSTPVAAIAT